jgi:hypothetical protein
MLTLTQWFLTWPLSMLANKGLPKLRWFHAIYVCTVLLVWLSTDLTGTLTTCLFRTWTNFSPAFSSTFKTQASMILVSRSSQDSPRFPFPRFHIS